KPNLIARGLERGLDLVVRTYAAMLRVVLRHRIMMGFVTIGTVVLTVWLYFKVPPGLFPNQDTGMISATIHGPQDISFHALRERPERTTSSQEVIHRLRPKLAAIEGIRTFLTARQDVRLGGRYSRAAYQYTLESADSRVLEEWGPKLTAAIRKLPEVIDVNS